MWWWEQRAVLNFSGDLIGIHALLAYHFRDTVSGMGWPKGKRRSEENKLKISRTKLARPTKDNLNDAAVLEAIRNGANTPDEMVRQTGLRDTAISWAISRLSDRNEIWYRTEKPGMWTGGWQIKKKDWPYPEWATRMKEPSAQVSPKPNQERRQ